VVESSAVEEAMVKVGNALQAYKAQPADDAKQRDFTNAIYRLSHAIRDGITSVWTGRGE
jgi:hypothetical protein